MNTHVTLDHGSGGLAGQQLVSSLFLKYLRDPVLRQLEDAAVLPQQDGRIALTTDSYVVDPIFFPGGNIGELAVNGTINDLAMQGAKPLAISLGCILEEGFPLADLERIIQSVAGACDYAGVPVVTGDTKVVPRGKADKIFINTSGIGIIGEGIEISAGRVKEGDIILLSGTLADHGITILTNREGLQVGGNLQSDTRPLHFLVRKILETAPAEIHTMRDPTRGGLGTTLSEIARGTNLCLAIDEEKIPMRPAVRAACELMGLDPLYLANEGKCMVIADQKRADEVLRAMRSIKEGSKSRIIGRVTKKYPGRVVLTTAAGGTRLVEPLTGEPLPRIC